MKTRTRLLIITFMALFVLSSCGDRYDALGFVMPDPSVDFWNDVYEPMDTEAVEERYSLPDEITMDNFVGMLASKGTSSVGRYYIVKNIAGNMRVFINEHNGSSQKIYRGLAPDERRILNLLNNIHVRMKIQDAYSLVGGDESDEAELYLKEDGVVYKVKTNNPFA